jgi:Helix-turn-helix domain/LysM domain
MIVDALHALRDPKGIAAEFGVSVSRIYAIGRRAGANRPKLERTIAALRSALDADNSVCGAAKAVNITPSYAAMLLGKQRWPNIGDRILALLRAGRTRMETAAELGISRKTVSRYIAKSGEQFPTDQHPRKADRNAEVIAAVGTGESLSAIGARFGITKQRVWQISRGIRAGLVI